LKNRNAQNFKKQSDKNEKKTH